MTGSVSERVGGEVVMDALLLSVAGGGVFAGSQFVDVGSLPVTAPGHVVLAVTVAVGYRLSRRVDP